MPGLLRAKELTDISAPPSIINSPVLIIMLPALPVLHDLADNPPNTISPLLSMLEPLNFTSSVAITLKIPPCPIANVAVDMLEPFSTFNCLA